VGVEKGAQREVCLIFSKSREKISVNLIFCQTAAARELPPPDFPMIATVVSTSSMETGAVEEAFFRARPLSQCVSSVIFRRSLQELAACWETRAVTVCETRRSPRVVSIARGGGQKIGPMVAGVPFIERV
jgi:hypothetical protein